MGHAGAIISGGKGTPLRPVSFASQGRLIIPILQAPRQIKLLLWNEQVRLWQKALHKSEQIC
jgi:hypothetical protein